MTNEPDEVVYRETVKATYNDLTYLEGVLPSLPPGWRIQDFETSRFNQNGFLLGDVYDPTASVDWTCEFDDNKRWACQIYTNDEEDDEGDYTGHGPTPALALQAAKALVAARIAALQTMLDKL